MKIPAPINRRVNELCEELEDLGHGDVDKHELVAAILVAATRDPDLKALAEMLLDYHQAKTFIELYRNRNRLQHASPDIDADEVHAQVRLLLNHLPRFVKSYLAWLAKHGIQV